MNNGSASKLDQASLQRRSFGAFGFLIWFVALSLTALSHGFAGASSDTRNAVMGSSQATAHNLRYVSVLGPDRIPVRDARGQTLSNLVTGAHHPLCPGGESGPRCVRVQGLEVVSSAAAGNLYYQWPWDGGGEQGFVSRGDLASTPSLANAALNGNGAASPPAPGDPRYEVVVRPIRNTLGYVGAGTKKAYTYAAYGAASAYGGNYALMTWNWTNKATGGIARAAVSGGESFYPSAVEAISLPTYQVVYLPDHSYGLPFGLLIPNGSITVRYGAISNGNQNLYGWMVMKHVVGVNGEGGCVEHMRFVSGTRFPDSTCPHEVAVG